MYRILFITGTRADYGKQKSLIASLGRGPSDFEVSVFVTGMHLHKDYGETWREIKKDFPNLNLYLFDNQNNMLGQEEVLTQTLSGINGYCKENPIDLIVVHGDRIEPLAAALCGLMLRIRVCHIEGGEVSGTQDETIRHTITKLSDYHFVANEQAERRIKQLGEDKESVFRIGSPEVDLFISGNLPNIDEVLRRYQISFKKYAILIFHPVTNEIDSIQQQASEIAKFVKNVEDKFVIILPNNDPGREGIMEAWTELIKDNQKTRSLPSMRFEYFVSLLKNCDYVLGNSSTGVRESTFFGIPSINVGTRQSGRSSHPLILHSKAALDELIRKREELRALERRPTAIFGDGSSGSKFLEVLKSETFWLKGKQKTFFDID